VAYRLGVGGPRSNERIVSSEGAARVVVFVFVFVSLAATVVACGQTAGSVVGQK
jgi:hypothetical protein